MEDEEFNVYASRGEAFSPEDQVANLLTENQNMPEIQSRVSECRSTYLSQLQMLLMGYHEDFIAVGKKMNDVCHVVDELKEATRQGRTAIGDVSAWTLPAPGDAGADDAGQQQDSGHGAPDGISLGDPWAADHHHSHHHHPTSSSSSSAAVDASSTTDCILPVTFLANITRSNEHRSASQDPQGQCSAAISSVRQTCRLLDSASERVSRRIHSQRQALAMKELEHLAEGAADRIGSSSSSGSGSGAPLALLRTATLDSFQKDSWHEHPLALGDLRPRWQLLADGGRLAAASSLMLRSHSALVSDFSDSFSHSSVDIRSATMRLSSTISAVVQHAGRMYSETCGQFDLGALQWWAHGQVQKAAAEIFGNNVERRKHTAPTAEAAAGSVAFRASAVASAADAVAMDLAIAMTFLPCEDGTCSPVAHSLLRVLQPAQLQLVWEQVQGAVTTDFNFSALAATREEEGGVLLAEKVGGAGELPRQSCIRCLSPQLPGVRQHRGMVTIFNSDEWQEACEQLTGTVGVAQLNSELLLQSYVSEASTRLWDHLSNLLSFRALVRNAVLEAQYEQQMHHQHQHQQRSSSAAAAAAASSFDSSSTPQLQEATDLVDFYFSGSPDWFAQLDLATTHLLSSFISALLEYRHTVGDEVQRVSVRELSKRLEAVEAKREARVKQGLQGVDPEEDDGPPTLRAFRPEQFLSAVDCGVLSALSAVLPATHLAAMLLPISFPTFSNNHNDKQGVRRGGSGETDVAAAAAAAGSNSDAGFLMGTCTCLTVANEFAQEAEQRIFRFLLLDAVYHRAPSTLHNYFSPNDLRLRADGGGCIDLSVSPAERAALFILSPFCNPSRGAGVLEWSVDSCSTLQTAEVTLVAMLSHKVLFVLEHVHRVGGPAATAMAAAALALFLCDEAAPLAKECWDVVKQRSPALRKIFDSSSNKLRSASIPKAVLSVLFMLQPVLSSSLLKLLLPNFCALVSYDSLVAHLRRLVSQQLPGEAAESDESATSFMRQRASLLRRESKKPTASVFATASGKDESGSSPSAPPPVFDSLIRQVASDAQQDFDLEKVPPCCWKSLSELQGEVQRRTVDEFGNGDESGGGGSPPGGGAGSRNTPASATTPSLRRFG